MPSVSLLAWFTNVCYLPVSYSCVNLWPLYDLSPKGPAPFSPWDNLFSWLGGFCNISLNSFFFVFRMPRILSCICTTVVEVSGLDLLLTTFQKAQPQLREACWTPVHIGCHISALLLVYRTAFPAARPSPSKPLLSSASILGGVGFYSPKWEWVASPWRAVLWGEKPTM